MRALALAAAASLAVTALACGGSNMAPAPPAETAAPATGAGATDGSPDVVANPQVFFVQIDT